MKTKPLLLLFALLSAMTWPAAAQPVWLDGPPNLATNTLTLPSGWSLIANPFFHLRGTTLRDARQPRAPSLNARRPTLKLSGHEEHRSLERIVGRTSQLPAISLQRRNNQ